jgi:G3E family GTPase
MGTFSQEMAMTTRLVLVGGFLGAGKTTLLLRAAQTLRDQGVSTALITNDQGSDLVDTALARERDIPVVEVPAGCFCCRFDALMVAIGKLDQEYAPEVILAEPVGSCTDLNATVVLPLEQMYRERYAIAPLAIAVDGRRLLSFVRQDATRGLQDDLVYLFTRQIEEAEHVLLNKCDLLSAAELSFLRNWLQVYCPSLRVLPVSGLTGEGMASWLADILVSQAQARPVLDLDYARYGQAEARLGWLNASGSLLGNTQAPAQEWAELLFPELVSALENAQLPIAHLKLFVEPASGEHTRGVIKVSATGPTPAIISWDSREQTLPAKDARWLLNARVDAAPEVLEPLITGGLGAAYAGIQAEIEALSCFQPSPPQPRYRFTGPTAPGLSFSARQE